MSAGRETDEQVIPSPVHLFAELQFRPYIALEMKIAVVLCRKQVTGPGVMPKGAKCPAHNSGEFTGDEDAQLRHGVTLR